MSSSKSNKHGILILPNELLYEIVQLSRPFAFEALILSCKRFHAVGQRLLQDHNLCKIWYSHWPRHRDSEEMELRDVFRFFNELSSLSKLQREWAPLYLRSIRYGSQNIYNVDKNTTTENILRSIMLNAPWLQKKSQQYYNFIQHIGFKDILIRDCGLSRYEDSDDENWEEAKDVQEQDLNNMGDNNLLQLLPLGLYEIMPFLLMINLESIIFDCFPLSHGPFRKLSPTIQATISHFEGHKYFQQLHTVQVSHPCSLNDIAPFLLLPLLKTLVLNNMRHSDDVHGYDGPINKQSCLSRLVFYSANIGSVSLGLFMSNLTSIESFVWAEYLRDSDDYTDWIYDITEESLDPFQNNRSQKLPATGILNVVENDRGQKISAFMEEHQLEDEDEIKETLAQLVEEGNATLDHPLIRTLCTFPTDYDSDEYVEDDGIVELGEDEVESDQYPGYSWSPSDIVNDVLVHRKTLKEVVLTIGGDTFPLEITKYEKDQPASQFRDFPNLTHLEIDTEILRNRVRKNTQIQPSSIPPSLVDMLPPSIEVIRLYARGLHIDYILGLVRRLPRHAQQFPNFREIMVYYSHHLDDGSERLYMLVLKLQMETLRQELEAAGIRLRFCGVNVEGSKRPIDFDSRRIKEQNNEEREDSIS